MTNQQIFSLVADSCGVFCFACGFVVAFLCFWLPVLHIELRG